MNSLIEVTQTVLFTPARLLGLGMYHSDLQSLRLVQDRRPAVVVDSFDANSFR